MAYLSPQAAHPFHGNSEVEVEAGTILHSEFHTVPCIVERPGCANHPLGWHTPHVKTVAPHEVHPDQGHLCTQTGGAGGGYQSGSHGSDHDQVVTTGRLRLYST